MTLVALLSAGCQARPSEAPAPQLAPLPIGRPMYQMDAQHTGRSPHIGPRQPILLRTFNTARVDVPDPIFGNSDIQSSAAIAPDGTAYIGLHSGTCSRCATRSAPATSSPRAGASIPRRLVVARDAGHRPRRHRLRRLQHQQRLARRAGHAVRAAGADDGHRAARPVVGRPRARAARRRRRPSARTARSTPWAATAGLSAISPDGQVRWTAQTGPVLKSSPALGATARSTCRA